MLGSGILHIRPHSPVIVRADFVEVGRDVQAVGLGGSKCLRKAEEASSQGADALCVQDLGSDHGRSDSGNLDAELISAHSNLLELLGIGASMLENGEGIVGESRGDLNEDPTSDERNELGSKLGALLNEIEISQLRHLDHPVPGRLTRRSRTLDQPRCPYSLTAVSKSSLFSGEHMRSCLST